MRLSFLVLGAIAIIITIASCNHIKDNSVDKAKYLRGLINKIGFQKLPFTYDLAKSITNSKYNVNKETMDSLWFENGQFGGVLPDTTNFYGIIYYQVGDSNYPFMVTIDKNGNLIDKKNIGIGHCRGLLIDIDSCVDIVTMKENLEINLFYKVIGFAEDEKNDESIKICNQIIGKGLITKQGKIELEKGELEVCK